MGFDLQRYRRRLNEARTSSSAGSYWRPEDGEPCYIRFMLFEHTVSEVDFNVGLYTPGECQVGDERLELDLPHFIHWIDGKPMNCTKDREGKCEFCDRSKELMASDDEADIEYGKRMRRQQRHMMNVVVIDDDPSEVKIYDAPKTVWQEVLTYLDNEEYGPDILGPKGRDFRLKKDSSQSPAHQYSLQIRDEKRCEDLDDLDTIDLIARYTGAPQPQQKSTPKEEEPEEKPKKRRGRPPKQKEDAAIEWDVGDKVEFDNEGDVYTGSIRSFTVGRNGENLAVVQEDDSEEEWDVEVKDLKKPSRRRRRSAK